MANLFLLLIIIKNLDLLNHVYWLMNLRTYIRHTSLRECRWADICWNCRARHVSYILLLPSTKLWSYHKSMATKTIHLSKRWLMATITWEPNSHSINILCNFRRKWNIRTYKFPFSQIRWFKVTFSAFTSFVKQ